MATERNILAFPCPCKDCHSAQRKSIDIIRKHHVEVGRDTILTKSMIRGIHPKVFLFLLGIWVEDVAYDNDDIIDAEEVDVQQHPPDNGVPGIAATTTYVDDTPSLDEYHDVHRQVMEAFDSGNALHREVLMEDVVLENEDEGTDTIDGLEELS